MDSDTTKKLRVLRRTEALGILRQIDMPRAQQNHRSAWVLLALADMRPARRWSRAAAPVIGITPIMDWIATHYGHRYKPNTRETIRRQSVHQFMQAGIVTYNGDAPDRATNSPKAVYQLSVEALTLLRAYGAATWPQAVGVYLAAKPGLGARYAAERVIHSVPVNVPDGGKIVLSPGAHNELIRDIIEKFAPTHTPGARLIYLGDTDDKIGYFDELALVALGVAIDRHGKMPDVILHDVRRNWLILAESVTSHGPVNSKRHEELKRLFANSKSGLVFVTAFPTQAIMARYLKDVAWETEVWIATAPTHLIHFNGERFLGPHS